MSLEYFRTVKLLTEYRLEFQSLKSGCKGSSESTLVKMPHCWKSYAMAQILLYPIRFREPHGADIALFAYASSLLRAQLLNDP